VLYSSLPVLAEKVKSQAVLLTIDYINQLLPQFNPLGGIDETLKH
jgi:hypothetical protein